MRALASGSTSTMRFTMLPEMSPVTLVLTSSRVWSELEKKALSPLTDEFTSLTYFPGEETTKALFLALMLERSIRTLAPAILIPSSARTLRFLNSTSPKEWGTFISTALSLGFSMRTFSKTVPLPIPSRTLIP